MVITKVSFDSLSGCCKEVLHHGSVSSILRLNDNSVLKIFNPDILKVYNLIGCDIESKVIDSNSLIINSQIIKANDVVYRDGKFLGYTMDYVCGDDIYLYCSNLPLKVKSDLNFFANLYSKVEEVVKSADNIVFPDLCTAGNVIIRNGKPVLIDYDGFQVGKYLSCNISSSLGNQNQYNNSKYRNGDYFTKELDIKSLITMYFVCTFGVNLSVVGEIDPINKKIITLDDIFDLIDLEDDDIKHKVWKTFDSTSKNEYLGNDVFTLSEDNTLLPINDNRNFRVLVKK